MRRMLVDDDQTVLGLGDDIGVGNLSACDSERMVGGHRRRRLGHFGAARDRRGRARKGHHPVIDARRIGWGRRDVRAEQMHRGFAALAEQKAARRRWRCRLLLPRRERGFGRALDAAKPLFVERAAQPADDHPAHKLRIAEPHFSFRRMDVHIDLARRQIEEERDDRMAIARQQIGIGAAQCPDEQPVLHRTAVDKQILMVGDAAVVGGQADHAAEPDLAALDIDPDAVCRQVALGQCRDTAETILAALHVEHAAPVMLDRKAHVCTRHRQTLHDIETGGIFAACAAQKLAPGRHAREQILDHHPRALCERRRSFGDEAAIIDHTAPPVRAGNAAFECQPRNAGDRRQGFAAKAHRRHILDRIGRQFRGRMALERERHVGRGHPAPIVIDFQPQDSALGDSHRNASRPRIEGVFDQFLERCGGSFDHFTGCDPIY